MRYRTRTDIMSDVLKTANGGGVGATKTRIMYKAFLSFRQTKEYLGVLTENNLLNYDAYTQTFETTEKSLRFLDAYNQMSDVTKTQQIPQW